MNRQIGLLIMRDENDILKEYLTKITKFYDHIFVLDGSDDDEGKLICAEFPEVVYYAKDKDVIIGDINDSIRGFLWEKAKQVPNKKWVAILHPDEFPSDNPLEMLEKIPDHIDSVEITNAHFFPHISQREEWKPEEGIEKQLKYYMGPGYRESRYFRFNTQFHFIDKHFQTCPLEAYRNVIAIDKFVHKHISFRTKEQSIKRAKTRIESGWQPVDYILVIEKDDIFFNTLKYPPEIIAKYPTEARASYYNLPHIQVMKINLEI